MNAPSSIPSGTKYPQTKVDQTPRYSLKRKLFRKKLKRGRPANNAPQQHWVK